MGKKGALENHFDFLYTQKYKDDLMIELTFTDKAQKKVKDFAVSEAKPEQVFRIYVQGGGCSGFEYGFSFDHATDNDYRLQFGEIELIIDPFSATYVQNATIDYVEDFRQAGFTVKNPNAKATCGCGLSFSV